MARRHGQKMGCCELAAVVFVLFVGMQVIVQGARVVAELALLAGTLLKWAALGVAGALAMIAAGTLVFGIIYGLGRSAQSLFGTKRPASLFDQARRWKRGIEATVGHLRRRGWLTKDDARRYTRSVDAAVMRIRDLEGDIATLRSLPGGEGSVATLQAAADTLLSRLERTHRALVRLLAESALEKAPLAQESLGQAADELESLLAALGEVTSSESASAFVDSQRHPVDTEGSISE